MTLKEVVKKSVFGKSLIRIKHEMRNFCYKAVASKSQIRRLKNSCVDKRCFIIGNGPSLSLEDLDKIKNEDCFAANRIYRIFPKTEWRPLYYCSQDTKVLDEIYTDIEDVVMECKYVFLSSYIYKKMKKHSDNILFFYHNVKDHYPEYPDFSYEISDEISEGFTITYSAIQIALYMGYKEIYLLGVDHSYNNMVDDKGNVITLDNVKNYMSDLEGNTWFPPQLIKSTKAYEKARLVCEEKNVLIRNATRGGKLEVFERVNFDDLF